MSVAVQLPLNNDIHTMATPSCSHLPASAASGSSFANAFDKSSDLPPMPVPYEGKYSLLDQVS